MYLKDNSILNKNIESFKTLHVIGISGIGLSALSHILDSKNIKISGSTNAFNKQTEKLQKKDQDIETYIDEVITADLKEAGDMDLISKVLEDFKAASENITEEEIKTKLDEFLEKAKADFQ